MHGILRERYPPGSRIREPLKGRPEIDALRRRPGLERG